MTYALELEPRAESDLKRLDATILNLTKTALQGIIISAQIGSRISKIIPKQDFQDFQDFQDNARAGFSVCPRFSR